jgi:hypothetical protein
LLVAVLRKTELVEYAEIDEGDDADDEPVVPEGEGAPPGQHVKNKAHQRTSTDDQITIMLFIHNIHKALRRYVAEENDDEVSIAT